MEDIMVKLAKDVLAKIGSKMIIPKGSQYLKMKNITYKEMFNLINQESFQNKDAKEAFNVPCEACVKSALFLAVIDRFNKVNVSDISSFDLESKMFYIDKDSPAKEYMLQYIDEDQLTMMEIAFEGRINSNDAENFSYIDDEKTETCLNFASDFNYKNRMKAIMLNIIANNGIFIPENGFDISEL